MSTGTLSERLRELFVEFEENSIPETTQQLVLRTAWEVLFLIYLVTQGNKWTKGTNFFGAFQPLNIFISIKKTKVSFC